MRGTDIASFGFASLLEGGNGMTTKQVRVSLLAMAAATICAVFALTLLSHRVEAATIVVKTCGGGTMEVNAYEKRMLELHNRARTKRDLKALCVYPALTRAARAHTQDMLNRDYASHTSPEGETIKQRLARFGYTLEGYSKYWIGENIVWGCGSSANPDDLFGWWMRSPGHRSAILNKNFRQVGIGVRTGTFKSCNQAAMSTVDFGTRLR